MESFTLFSEKKTFRHLSSELLLSRVSDHSAAVYRNAGEGVADLNFLFGGDAVKRIERIFVYKR